MLRVGVLAKPADLRHAVAYFAQLGASNGRSGPQPSIEVRRAVDADLRSFAFVVGIGHYGSDTEHELADVWLRAEGNDRSVERAIETLWDERIVPFERNLRSGVRAPRRQRALIVQADPSWPGQARRLIGRLDLALGHLAERIDHIGSTSVPGLPAKDLVDIQVVVADLTIAVDAARAAASAGFVHVSGSVVRSRTRGTVAPRGGLRRCRSRSASQCEHPAAGKPSMARHAAVS